MFAHALLYLLSLKTWALVNVVASCAIAAVLVVGLVKFIDPNVGSFWRRVSAYWVRFGVAWCVVALMGNAMDSLWALTWPDGNLPVGEITMNAGLALTLVAALFYHLTGSKSET